MGATSVTGVGHGSADGSNKGSEHMTLGVSHLIGPHIVMAKNGTLSGGTLTVDIPDLPGVVGDYFVLCTGTAAAARSSAITDADADDGTWEFTLTGTTTDVVKWAVVKLGL